MTKRCPLTYQTIAEDERYSAAGLKKLKTATLHDLEWSAEEQRDEARNRVTKLSIQGVQLKLSAKLNRSQGRFKLVDVGGKYILKPPSADYHHMPENEDLTMRLAKACNIDVPLHGLLYAKDGSLTYVIERFDRQGHQKIAVEDFAQLSGLSRHTKYDASMEQVLEVINTHCTFPVIERVELLRRMLFCFLAGNEDMHLKNFSLIVRNGKVTFSPAYDLLNSTLLLGNAAQEEIALPLNGKKRNLKRKTFIDYFAIERMELNLPTVEGVLSDLTNAAPTWMTLIESSFLSDAEKAAYKKLIAARASVLGL